MDYGWSILTNSAGRESGPTAFQFGTPHITDVMSSMVGSSPCDGANGRCGNRAQMAGSRLYDFEVRRVPKTLAHHSRMRTLSLSSEPSTSRVKLVASPSHRLTPLCPSGVCITPLVVVGEDSLRSSRVLFEEGVQSSINRRRVLR